MVDFVDTAIDAIIKTEGGYVNHPSDKGGETKYGITIAVARDNGYDGNMADLPIDFARHVYRERYYYSPGFNAIAFVSEPVAKELFDSGVNFGTGVPSIWFQRWLNGFNRQQKDYPDLMVDGRIGRGTVKAFETFLKVRGKEGERVMLTALNASQGARYLELAEGRKANEDFLYGWVRNRVAT